MLIYQTIMLLFLKLEGVIINKKKILYGFFYVDFLNHSINFTKTIRCEKL